MVLNHHCLEFNIIFQDSFHHVGMVMQIFLVTQFSLRSESAWWDEYSFDEKHLEVVADQLVTENYVQ
jgi:hypothetical protein